MSVSLFVPKVVIVNYTQTVNILVLCHKIECICMILRIKNWFFKTLFYYLLLPFTIVQIQIGQLQKKNKEK